MNTIPHHQFGAFIQNDNTIHFKVWAPNAQQVEVNIHSPPTKTISMTNEGDGIYTAVLENPPPQVDYTYTLDGKIERPDPASHWQPHGIDSPSRVCAHHTYKWNDQDWKGIDLREMIIYELHIGTFSPQGTFESVIDKIPHLKELGINTIELMPISTFSGKRNWGYDGVQLYAPQESYGGPFGLKLLIDTCHQHGIAVLLDVVYNHFGPEGNFLEDFGPYFTTKYTTPWGKAVNYDEAYATYVRDFVIENALYWLTHYQIDGLRLDAIHGIFDQSAYHFLEELRDRFAEKAKQLGRKAWLIAESDLNDPKHVSEQINGGYGLDGQWNDDFHHSLHAFLTESQTGYFQDYGSLKNLSKSLTYGFVYDGIWSNYRKRIHGKSSVEIPGFRLVNFIQNHDQIANASNGQRLATLIDQRKYLLASAVLLLSPSIPLLFMGQEWGATTPFYFFTDFRDPDLQQAVKEGRLKEYASNGIAEGFHDPGDIETYRSCMLNWDWREDPEKKEMFENYKCLISLRKEHPALNNCRKTLTNVRYNEEDKWLIVERSAVDKESCIVFINFSGSETNIPTTEHIYQGESLYSTEPVQQTHEMSHHIKLPALSLAVFDCTLASHQTSFD
jgi:maltooligosyltrehalose trehalohydrolase